MRMYRCKEQYSSCKDETNAKCREDKAMEMMKELNLEQMQEVAGGERHFEPEPAREGWTQHKVTATDTLIRIANRYHISDWRIIRKWNPHINPKTNMIRTGEYLWIKL